MADTVTTAIGSAPGLAVLRPELDCVVEGIKPAARHTMRQSASVETIAMLASMGVCATFFLPADARAGIAYLGLDEQEKLLREPRGHLLYAKDRATCAQLLRTHEEQDNEAIGALLGYPPCCVEANLLYDRLPYNDYVRTARVSDGFDWRLNLFIGGWQDCGGRQLQLISHFPCSLTCTRSARQAEMRLDLLDRSAPDLSCLIQAAAKMPILLYDDSGLPPARRKGLHGAALETLELGDELIVAGLHPLRGGTDLPRWLARVKTIHRQSGEFAFSGPDIVESVNLENQRWMLLLPR